MHFLLNGHSVGVAIWRTLNNLTKDTHIHTHHFINPRSHVTLQDAKTVNGEIEKEAKKKKKLSSIIYNK